MVGGLPKVHDSPEKRQMISIVEVFQTESGDWVSQPTGVAPPAGSVWIWLYCNGRNTPLLWRLLDHDCMQEDRFHPYRRTGVSLVPV